MHSRSTFHLKAPQWIFKATNISLLLFLLQNQFFYLVTLFIALILFRYIILKLNLTQIYLLKSHSLDLSLKRFHKHSRSSFREIILFAWNFKENLQLACIRFLFLLSNINLEISAHHIGYLKGKPISQGKIAFLGSLFTFFNQF